jgi:cell division protein FtsA
MKGYSDYEHQRKQFENQFRKFEIPENLRKTEVVVEEEFMDDEELQAEKVRNRKGMKDFWGKFKDGIIELFKEEEDHAL